jgi:hypothetical protein
MPIEGSIRSSAARMLEFTSQCEMCISSTKQTEREVGDRATSSMDGCLTRPAELMLCQRKTV